MFRTCLTAVLFVVASDAVAQERIADYDNSVRVEYQFIHTGALDTGIGPLDIGETDTHVLLLSGVFSLNERWKIYGSIPYVKKRHQGASPHDFSEFSEYTPPDLRQIDDGHFHGGFQDFFGGVQYLAVDGPSFSLSPFISYGVPVSDYPFYANAAIGKQIWELPVGVSMEFTPYFQTGYSGQMSHTFSRKKYWGLISTIG